MSRVIRWFAVNRVAANLLAAFILVAGFMAVPKIRREVFPEFDSNWVLVQVPYPGAASAEVEEGICVKIEDAVQGLQGVKQVVSTASEGLGVMSVELLPRTNSGRLLDEVK
ncbi:MAG: acriflavin resistance protein, partial [Verrucomicrobiales bacterium]|nr:acriflavin resistance protein [Verrucomicrobiales bacterium]